MTDDVIPVPTPELEEDPAVAALETIRRGDRRREVRTLVLLAVVLFFVWRVNDRADTVAESVDKIADSSRLAALVDCREADYERAQGLLVSTLVDRTASRENVPELAADYARASARLGERVTSAEEAECLKIYGSILEPERRDPP